MTDEDVLVAGETLVDFVPESTGSLSSVESFTRRAGGAPANVAVALSRLGREPLFWTRVGEGPFGSFLRERLETEGVSQRFVERDDEADTTLAFVSREETDPTFTFYRTETADTRLDPETVPDAALDDVEWVHAGGVALAAEPARSATLDLLERASDRDCIVSFDPNVRPELWANDVELSTVCGWAVETADVLVATPEELVALGLADDGMSTTPAERSDDGGTTTEDSTEESLALARAATESGPHTVVLTIGADGAVAVATDDASWTDTVDHAGFDVEAVDPTGAGDAFTAGLIDALLRDATLADAVAFGNAVGALATTGTGAMAAQPDREAASALVDE